MAGIIGTISAIITLVETSIKIYDSAQRDVKLLKTFEVVRRRLPVIIHTLVACKSNLELKGDSIPEDVCQALDKTLDVCEVKALNLRGIFEKIIPGESDTRDQRYLKILRRLGKGNKVEEIMLGLTEDVQLIVNLDVVKSANQHQNAELENIVQEMKSIISLAPDEEGSGMSFASGGGAQTNNINRGSGQLINNNGSVGTQHFNSTRSLLGKRQTSDFVDLSVSVSAKLLISLQNSSLVVMLSLMAETLHPTRELRMQKRLVLGGMGGIGKTQLAIAYAESRSGFYSSVFWLNSASEAVLKDSFRSIARLVFDFQDLRLLESKEIFERVHQWLSDPTNTGWLLIFDNYDAPSQFDINDYYPAASHGAIIVTTRRPDHVAGSSLHVKPFQDIKDSLAILQTRSNRENVKSDPHAKCLVKRLAGLPLALATAGAYLQRSPFSIERYLQEYEKRWNIDPRRPTKLLEYQDRTFYTTWNLSYDRLKTEDLDAARLLKLLAYFDNENLWHELFYGGLSDTSPDWLHRVISDDLDFNGTMNILTEYCFIEFQPTSESWSMHNCVHDWTSAALNKKFEPELYWYVVKCIDVHIDDVDETYLQSTQYSRLAAHGTRIALERFLREGGIDRSAPEQLSAFSRISILLQHQIELVPAERILLQILSRKEKELGPTQISTLETARRLGLLYSNRGKLREAEQMLLRVIVELDKGLGSDHSSTLRAINDLGDLYLEQGKPDEAEKLYIRALSECEKVLGPGHTSTIRTIDNLGKLYAVRGKTKEAKEMFSQALAGYKRVLGPDHTSVLHTTNKLGALYHEEGNLDKAEQMYTLALSGYEKYLGPNHTSMLDSVNNLGRLYAAQGKQAEAMQMFCRALDGYENRLGPSHISTLKTVHNLGILYHKQGRLDEAEMMFIRALNGKETALGPGNRLTLDNFVDLAELYMEQGKLLEAENLVCRGMSGLEKILSPSHPSLSNSFKDLAKVLPFSRETNDIK
ncbi:TPR repeat protein [Penicillium canescens]|uniref:TPR repeat protein n=1 Tax=Penicillium canescens TaxID=5083 RepID=A0AAD6IJ51_PENCN|nr:TPR repeat protein [Penicillium canescens]KAJ6065267.1 TPR repeat protein [Penicillium canescens]